eukprot:TRINITY_DN20957_c0_g1_i1.p2 TRINITY_DN20957_c0_g1~~TRINITY_DN20957_c0_g1_i1.p2  ORF type:complete len:158 (-),score=33.52 TRINITY_DN20957_c0_g1_i1:476-949(-)
MQQLRDKGQSRIIINLSNSLEQLLVFAGIPFSDSGQEHARLYEPCQLWIGGPHMQQPGQAFFQSTELTLVDGAERLQDTQCQVPADGLTMADVHKFEFASCQCEMLFRPPKQRKMQWKERGILTKQRNECLSAESYQLVQRKKSTQDVGILCKTDQN